MKLTHTAQSNSDLEEIGDYIALDDPGRAVSFIDEIRDHCDGLVEFPERYPIYSQQGGRVVRRSVYGNYLIFFEIKADYLFVLRVVHGARDLTRMSF